MADIVPDEKKKTKFEQDTEELAARFDEQEKGKEVNFKKLSEQYKAFDEISKGLMDKIKTAEELGIDIPNLDLIKQSLTYALGQQAQVGIEMFNIINPPQEPESTATTINVSNPNDPSGFDEIEIDNDRLDRILNDPEFMREEVIRLSNQNDSNSQAQLKAIEQLVGQQMTEPLNEDIIRIQGTDVTEEQIRQPGLLSRDSRDVLSAATTQKAFNDQIANNARPIESRIKNSIAEGIRKISAQRREKLGL